MSIIDWRRFLEQFSNEVLADRRLRFEVPDEVLRSKWMGFEPASEKEIAEMEARISARIPVSYRSFLRTTNGWRQFGYFIEELKPTACVDWFRNSNPDWLATCLACSNGPAEPTPEEHCIYGEAQDSCCFRTEYLKSALQIADSTDNGVYLLNPRVVALDGEWEAWFLASWLPGARRYPSFAALLEGERRSFLKLRDHEESRYHPEDGIESLPSKVPNLMRSLAVEREKLAGWHVESEKCPDTGKVGRLQGMCDALEAAEHAVGHVLRLGLPPPEMFDRLLALGDQFSAVWKIPSCEKSQDYEYLDGRASGTSLAARTIFWFLDVSSSAAYPLARKSGLH